MKEDSKKNIKNDTEKKRRIEKNLEKIRRNWKLVEV